MARGTAGWAAARVEPRRVCFTRPEPTPRGAPLPFSWVEPESALWVPGSDDVLLIGLEAHTRETFVSNLYRGGIGGGKPITHTGDVIGAGTSPDGGVLCAR